MGLMEGERCSTCGASETTLCHLEGSHDDAFELGFDRGIESAQEELTRLRTLVARARPMFQERISKLNGLETDFEAYNWLEEAGDD